MKLDALIFGGGAAGLWLLDDLHRAGHRALLLEANALGAGQTVASQGIIHGGAKYTLVGKLTGSAKSIRAMPAIWRECLVGGRAPKLIHTRVRSEHCHLWRTESLKGRAAMIGAKRGLQVAPVPLPRVEWPAPLARCPGSVARIDEQVIDPVSFVADLAAQHCERTLKIDWPDGVSIERDFVVLKEADVKLEPRVIVLTAGKGNEAIRARAGLFPDAMQTRPLHMVMARGTLPAINGHCVDGAKTRVTITSATDAEGRTVWLIGGQVAEDGVEMDRDTLINHTKRELTDVIPGLDLAGAEWATYHVDRAEGASQGSRPEDVQILREGSFITAWPTKLALAPQLAARIAEMIGSPEVGGAETLDGPRPDVALPPWEEAVQWT